MPICLKFAAYPKLSRLHQVENEVFAQVLVLPSFRYWIDLRSNIMYDSYRMVTKVSQALVDSWKQTGSLWG
jgi:hypothetical protein